MPPAIYDKAAIKAELATQADLHPRQGSALALATGVSTTTANRWLSRAHPDVPTPEKWQAIEGFFEMQAGHLAQAGGLAGQPSPETEVGRLTLLVADLQTRVERLEQIDAGGRRLRAADTGKDPGPSPAARRRPSPPPSDDSP